MISPESAPFSKKAMGSSDFCLGVSSAPIHAGIPQGARSGRRAPSRGYPRIIIHSRRCFSRSSSSFLICLLQTPLSDGLKIGTEGLSNPYGSKSTMIGHGLEAEESPAPTSPKDKTALKMQTFGLGADGVFGGVDGGQHIAHLQQQGLAKGERLSPCGQFVIDSDGNWKPNATNPPSRKGARDPLDPHATKRDEARKGVAKAPAKFGRRATPMGNTSRKPLRPPRDSSYDTAL